MVYEHSYTIYIRQHVIASTYIQNHHLTNSFACPLIAGMVACLWQAFPNKPAKEIIDLVRQSGNNYQYPDNIMGYGIPDFWSAYQSATYLNQ